MSASPAGTTVVITGAGVISPLGDEPAAVHAALLAGRSAIGPTSFETDGVGERMAAEIHGFEPTAYLGAANLRPLDRPARLASAAASKALTAAGWRPAGASGAMPARAEAGAIPVGLVLGTMFGSLRTIAEFDRRAVSAGPTYASPIDFANSVINAAAGQAAIWHGMPELNATIAGGAPAGVVAIGFAVDQIRAGRAQRLLAGGAEELCFESLVGFGRLGLLAPAGDAQPRPFDRRRCGFALGEGAALLALETEDAAAERGAAVLARVLGHGSAFDPSRGTQTESGAAAMARAIRAALAESGIDAEDVDAVSCSASGLPGDRDEAGGLRAVFGERLASLPVTAVKAQLGEALGAAGAYQTLAALGAFESGELPGIAGLEEAEDGIGLTAAHARARAVAPRYVLVTARGFDGQTAALVLAAPNPRAN